MTVLLNRRLSNPNWFFMAIIATEISLTMYFIFSNRIPHGHDALQELMLRYYFWNSTVTTGDIPLWMPYMTHGTVANWWYFIQGGFLQNSVLALGPTTRHISFLALYHMQNCLEICILLLGVWLLSSKLYKTPIGRIFALVAIAGIVVWTHQIWFNLRWVYTLPLILYLVHEFLETGSWKFAIGGLMLFTTQWVGNLPYVLSAQAMVIAVYVVSLILSDPLNQWRKLTSLSWPRWHHFLLILIALLPLYFGYVILSNGTDQIVSYNYGRNPDGSTSFDGFKTYGGGFTIATLQGFLFRSTSSLGLDIYLGWITSGLVILALFYVRRRAMVPLITTSVWLWFFAIGEPAFFMRLLYDWFPAMRYFRHVGHAVIVLRLLLCLIAAFAIDEMIRRGIRGTSPRRIALVIAVLMIVWGGWWLNQLWAFAGGIALLMATDHISFHRHRHYASYLIIGLLTLELATYQFEMTTHETRSLSPSSKHLVSYTPMQYVKRRCFNVVDYPPRNDRVTAFQALPLGDMGSIYWNTESFLMEDCLASPFRVDHFLAPFDQYMKLFWGQPILDTKVIPVGRHPSRYIGDTIDFPLTPLSAYYSGSTNDKIQFYDSAYIGETPESAGRLLANPSLHEPILVVQAPRTQADPLLLPDALTIPKAPTKMGNTSHAIPYEVTKFSSNQIQLLVTAPMQPTPIWLLYADVWHPSWRATINGSPSAIYRANLAYKAIPLNPGTNRIELQFDSPSVKFAYYAFSFFSVSCLIWIAWLAKRYFAQTPSQ
ncbi:MAG: hypothetical protein HZA59_00030 [Hydrogenophilales bacterium]|nr:hypothetical protein [Hydrogenophilales bacterium]